jgi:NAD(P)-dependent dehydrogenase (short-subunit alcohol dehydrogenase family)
MSSTGMTSSPAALGGFSARGLGAGILNFLRVMARNKVGFAGFLGLVFFVFLGPAPLALLADTECEDFERALQTNLLGPFRLSKALLGALAASAREGRGAVIVNISSDAAVTPYETWGAYGASKAALRHLSAIWNQELAGEGVSVLSIDPGDMDTPLHALAMPGADRAALKRPEAAASELIAAITAALPVRAQAGGDAP